MPRRLPVQIAIAHLLVIAAVSDAEVLVRWTERHVPPPDVLGIQTLLVPAANRDAVRDALTLGYRVYVEVSEPAAATFTPPGAGLAGVIVRGKATAAQLARLRQRLGVRQVPVSSAEERGKWPHIRANWVTRNNEVLQVAGRSAQPWIETNAALVRIASAADPAHPPLLVYDWAPMMEPGIAREPALEDYLVAVAEAGSLGADLVLPVHERFQRRLLLGDADARRDWSEVRRHVQFYSGELARRFLPIASIGVVTSRPMAWFEMMNLLARHNLSFEVIAPSQLRGRTHPPPGLLLVLDELDPRQAEALAEVERQGSAVRTVKEVPDPNAFALEMRKVLGRDKRVADVWNGMTVLVVPYKERDGEDVLLALLNYAHQALPVQLRVHGTFARVYYESPAEPGVLLPHQSRDGFTEVVVPSLLTGGRIFFSRLP